MFTGLIENIGTIKNVARDSSGMKAEITTDIPLSEVAIGDSIACNGPCLTVVSKTDTSFSVELSYETVQRTTWKTACAGDRVNLERALRVGDRLGGHIVSGHIDGVGKVSRRQEQGKALDIFIQCGNDILKYVILKGSIAIDGISLTVNKVSNDSFSVTLIPLTQGETTLSGKRPGEEVNLECDIVGKYIEKLISKDGKVDRQLLAKNGFLK